MKNKNPYGRLKVLIVEDDSPSQDLLTEFIKPFATLGLIASTGKKALQLHDEYPDLDLILMDIQMPDMNGYDITRKIREVNKDIIIIAQTAYALPNESGKAMEAGCNGFISKPIYKQELYTIVSKFFD